MGRSPQDTAAIDRLIEDCTFSADANRRVAHAFRSRSISKGPAQTDGSLNPETVAAMEQHAKWAAEAERLRDDLFDLREGRIDHLP